jgi:hypothetical protein
MSTTRKYATATLLNNGQVLVTGGQGNSGYLSSAELYNPVNNTWSPASSMSTARFVPTATLLNNGLVLLAGGVNNSGYLSSAELYNPDTNTWSATASMSTTRHHATATLLNKRHFVECGAVQSGHQLLVHYRQHEHRTRASPGGAAEHRSGPHRRRRRQR